MAIAWEKEMAELVGERFITEEKTREKLSKDYFWYSPVLEAKLREKIADGIVIPENEEEVAAVLAFAYRNRIPVTTRGAGTGNYGQAVPLSGGIVLDVSRLDAILEIGEGYARAQCGVKLGVLEKEARGRGQELRIFPSTYMVATVGGFVSGGSGGIGSITWGSLWDGNVLEAVIYTMEERPRRLIVSGDALVDYIHSYGTTGVLTEVVVPLAPRKEWLQSVYHFDALEQATLFAERLSKDEGIGKRLVSVMEWPIPSYFKPLAKQLESGSAAVLLETEDGSAEALDSLAKPFGGRLGHTVEAARYKQTVSLSDFTWNHTTLWALRTDPTLTYLQAAFSATSFLEQLRAIKAKFGDEVLMHQEWVKARGVIAPSSLPVVRYTNEERLNEIIGFFESIGVRVSNPHTWVLDDGGRGGVNGMRLRKKTNDPLQLLNPGKIATETS